MGKRPLANTIITQNDKYVTSYVLYLLSQWQSALVMSHHSQCPSEELGNQAPGLDRSGGVSSAGVSQHTRGCLWSECQLSFAWSWSCLSQWQCQCLPLQQRKCICKGENGVYSLGPAVSRWEGEGNNFGRVDTYNNEKDGSLSFLRHVGGWGATVMIRIEVMYWYLSDYVHVYINITILWLGRWGWLPGYHSKHFLKTISWYSYFHK